MCVGLRGCIIAVRRTRRCHIPSPLLGGPTRSHISGSAPHLPPPGSRPVSLSQCFSTPPPSGRRLLSTLRLTPPLVSTLALLGLRLSARFGPASPGLALSTPPW